MTINTEHSFITADHHLGETRMTILQRPFSGPLENAEVMLQNHNSLVSPDDLVYFIGDVLCKDADPNIWLPWIKKFNGRKILLRGNHERNLTDSQLLEFFQEIIPEGKGLHRTFEGIDCFLNHYPTEGLPDKFNIVGHIHGAWKVQLNSFNAGVDVNHFRPVPTSSIPFYLKAITEFFDNDVWVAYNEINSSWRYKRGKKGRYLKG